MTPTDKLLLAIAAFLLLIFVVAFSFAKTENFDDLGNIVSIGETFIESQFSPGLDYSPEALRAFQQNHKHNSVLVTIKNGKYDIVYDTSSFSKNPMLIENFINFMNILKTMHPNLPDCTFVQSFNDNVVLDNTVGGVFYNSVKFDQTAVLSPFWFMISELRINKIEPKKWIYDKAVWRGARTGNYESIWNSRRFLVEKSLDYPNSLDAKYVDHKTSENEKSVDEHIDYRFIVSKDGNGGTYGLYWQLSSGRCVLMNTEFKQWFSPFFERDIHYKTYDDDNTANDNIVQVISETPESEKIAKACKKRAGIVFSRGFVFGYTLKLLQKLNRVQGV